MASVDEMVRFRVRIVPDRECVILALHGELDMVSVDAVQAALDELNGTGWTSLVLDLRELTFIDSTGLSLLLAAERDAQRVVRRSPSSMARRQSPGCWRSSASATTSAARGSADDARLPHVRGIYA